MNDEGKTRNELAQADRHIKEAEARVWQQRKRVAELSAGGHDAEEAEKLLARLVELLATMVQHRQTILRELESKG
jgi:multidrug resistance efflux pump